MGIVSVWVVVIFTNVPVADSVSVSADTVMIEIWHIWHQCCAHNNDTCMNLFIIVPQAKLIIADAPAPSRLEAFAILSCHGNYMMPHTPLTSDNNMVKITIQLHHYIKWRYDSSYAVEIRNHYYDLCASTSNPLNTKKLSNEWTGTWMSICILQVCLQV